MGQSNDGLVRLRTRLLAEWCRKVMGLRDPCTMTEVRLEGEEESAKAQGKGPDGLCRLVVRSCDLGWRGGRVGLAVHRPTLVADGPKCMQGLGY